MQIENDYDKEVYNGDIGYIDAVDTDPSELTASFGGHSVNYGFGQLEAMVPAYAASIHKSQGLEYPAVVIPVMTQHYPMLQRNLLYTGVTRARGWSFWSARRRPWRGPQCVRTASLVEVERMAGIQANLRQRQERRPTMNERKAHDIWLEQCEVAKIMEAEYGLTAALDYIVGEKLMTFAETARTHADFARELPRFVSEVRRMFPAGEICTYLEQIERARHDNHIEAPDEDDPLGEDPETAAQHARQFLLLKELLTATNLGTS